MSAIIDDFLNTMGNKLEIVKDNWWIVIKNFSNNMFKTIKELWINMKDLIKKLSEKGKKQVSDKEIEEFIKKEEKEYVFSYTWKEDSLNWNMVKLIKEFYKNNNNQKDEMEYVNKRIKEELDKRKQITTIPVKDKIKNVSTEEINIKEVIKKPIKENKKDNNEEKQEIIKTIKKLEKLKKEYQKENKDTLVKKIEKDIEKYQSILNSIK